MRSRRHDAARRLVVAVALVTVPLACSFLGPTPRPPVPPTQSPLCGTPQPHETNGSVEQPEIPVGQIGFFSSAQVPGWFGNPADAITVVRGPLNGEVAFDGAQMAIVRPLNGLGIDGGALSTGRRVAFSLALKALTVPTVVHVQVQHDGRTTELGAPTISNNGPDRNGWTLLTFNNTPISRTPMKFIVTAPTATRGIFLDDVQVRPLASACDDLGSVDSGASVDLPVLANDLGTRLKITSAGTTIPASALVVTRFDDHLHVDATPGVTGTFAIPYTIQGGAGAISQASATVVVSPKAVDDNVTIGISAATTSIDVLANDLGPNRTIESVADPVHGTAVIVGNHIDYTTDRSFVGLEPFNYTMVSNGVRSVATVRVMLQRVSDLKVSVADPVPSVPLAGATFVLPFTVSNSGPSAATQPLLTLTLPAGVSFVPGNGCEDGPPRCSMPVGALLASGGQTTFYPVFRAAVSGPFQISAGVSSVAVQATVELLSEDPNPANDTATGSVTVAPAADVRVANAAITTSPVQPGSAIAWTADVANDGPSIASSTKATFRFASSVSSVTASVTGAPTVACTTTSGSATCPFGDMPSGTLRHVTLSGHVAGGASLDDLVFESSVTSGVADPDPTNNDRLISAGALPQADLEVGASLTSLSPLQPGDPADYSIVTTNHGPADAQGVTLVLTLPVGITVLTPPSGCVATLERFECRLGALAAGSSRTTTVNASNVVRNQGSPDKIVTAMVVAATPDPSPANNVANVDTPIHRTADVSVQFAALGVVPAPSIVGVNTILYAVVENKGPSTATDVVTTLDVPAGFTIVNSHPECTDTRPVVCTVPSIPAGSIAVTDVYGQYQVPPAGPQTFTATTTAAQPDPSLVNNTNTRDVTPITAGDLGITGRIDRVPVTQNQANAYLLTVRNGGPSGVGAGSTVTLKVSSAITIGALPAGCSQAGTLITCTLGPFASTDTTTLTIPFTTGGNVPVPLIALATVKPPGGITDLDPTNNQAQLSSATFGVVDIAVHAAFPEVFAAPGGTAVGVYTIENHGPNAIRSAEFDVYAPRDWEFVSASGARCFQVGANTAVHCQTAAITAGDQVIVTITVTVPVAPLPLPDQPLGDTSPETQNPTGPVVGPNTNASLEQLTVIAKNEQYHDPDLTNGTATVDVTRLAAVDVKLTATPPATVTVGSPATFSFDVANVGAGATTLNSLLLTPAAGATFQSSTGATCTGSAIGINCPLPDLALGESTSVTVTLGTAGVTGTNFHLFATAYTFGFDDDGTNNFVLLDVPVA